MGGEGVTEKESRYLSDFGSGGAIVTYLFKSE